MAHPEEPTLPEDIPVQRKNKNINNVLHDIGPFVVENTSFSSEIKTEGRSCLGWKHIAIPGYGAALIIFFKVLLLSPIRHYFPDCRAVERTGAWQRPSGI